MAKRRPKRRKKADVGDALGSWAITGWVLAIIAGALFLVADADRTELRADLAKVSHEVSTLQIKIDVLEKSNADFRSKVASLESVNRDLRQSVPLKSPPALPDFDLPKPTAICRDGTKSYSQSRQGTCSWHDGVAEWL